MSRLKYNKIFESQIYGKCANKNKIDQYLVKIYGQEYGVSLADSWRRCVL